MLHTADAQLTPGGLMDLLTKWRQGYSASELNFMFLEQKKKKK